MSEASELKVVCMDCKVVMKKGPPGALESHGICPRCHTIRIAELNRMVFTVLPDDREEREC